MAADSKIVAPHHTVLALPDRENDSVILVDSGLSEADQPYSGCSMQYKRFLRADWQAMVVKVKQQGFESNVPPVEVIREVLRERHDLMMLRAEGAVELKQPWHTMLSRQVNFP